MRTKSNKKEQPIRQARHLQSINFNTGEVKFHPKKEINIFVHDPSIRGWGWAVLNLNGDVLSRGCIKTEPKHKKLRIRKGDDDIRRINEIIDIFYEIINSYNIKLIVGELSHGSQSSAAAGAIGICKAILQTTAKFSRISIEWFSEGDSKKACLGKTTATKQEMIDRMDQLYEVNWMTYDYQNEAIADALAIHHTAIKLSETLKLLSNL